jgi:hypothetical protein
VSLIKFSSTAYNDVSYFIIVEICAVGGLKQAHKVSKHLRPFSLKTCDMSTD